MVRSSKRQELLEENKTSVLELEVELVWYGRVRVTERSYRKKLQKGAK